MTGQSSHPRYVARNLKVRPISVEDGALPQPAQGGGASGVSSGAAPPHLGEYGQLLARNVACKQRGFAKFTYTMDAMLSAIRLRWMLQSSLVDLRAVSFCVWRLTLAPHVAAALEESATTQLQLPSRRPLVRTSVLLCGGGSDMRSDSSMSYFWNRWYESHALGCQTSRPQDIGIGLDRGASGPLHLLHASPGEMSTPPS